MLMSIVVPGFIVGILPPEGEDMENLALSVPTKEALPFEKFISEGFETVMFCADGALP
jgi:hypothetical protein